MPSLEKHCADKHCHLLKFVSFADKNVDYPFVIKKRVMDAALLSALMYGCEAWLSECLRPMHTTYMSAIKTLLGVRKTTTNDLCLTEIGYPSLKGYVKEIQYNFFKRICDTRENMPDDPFMFVLNLCRNANTPCARYIRKLLDTNGDLRNKDIETIKQRIRLSEKSKYVTYKEINPDLVISSAYSVNHVIEYQRMSFTKFRLSAHNLLIEMGRWSRIPRHLRLCSCNEDVQTELHVLSNCPRTVLVREKSRNVDCSSFVMFFASDPIDICRIIHNCLREFN